MTKIKMSDTLSGGEPNRTKIQEVHLSACVDPTLCPGNVMHTTSHVSRASREDYTSRCRQKTSSHSYNVQVQPYGIPFVFNSLFHFNLLFIVSPFGLALSHQCLKPNAFEAIHQSPIHARHSLPISSCSATLPPAPAVNRLYTTVRFPSLRRAGRHCRVARASCPVSTGGSRGDTRTILGAG